MTPKTSKNWYDCKLRGGYDVRPADNGGWVVTVPGDGRIVAAFANTDELLPWLNQEHKDIVEARQRLIERSVEIGAVHVA